MGVIEYDSNNSGGSWWLSDEDWRKLEAAGWVVHWIHDLDDPSHVHDGDEAWMHERTFGFDDHHHGHANQNLLTAVTPSGSRWLGALARSAAKRTDDPEGAIREWETGTGQDSTAEGCNCCGEPHSFSFTDDDGNRRYSGVEVVQTRRSWS